MLNTVFGIPWEEVAECQNGTQKSVQNVEKKSCYPTFTGQKGPPMVGDPIVGFAVIKQIISADLPALILPANVTRNGYHKGKTIDYAIFLSICGWMRKKGRDYAIWSFQSLLTT
jgi:hypothetical protein